MKVTETKDAYTIVLPKFPSPQETASKRMMLTAGAYWVDTGLKGPEGKPIKINVMVGYSGK